MRQTTLHREVEEHDRECELDHAPRNEKTFALTHTQELRRRDKVSKTCVVAFKKSVKKCVIAIIEKLLEKSPIGSVMVRNACVFNPDFIASSELNKTALTFSMGIEFQ